MEKFYHFKRKISVYLMYRYNALTSIIFYKSYI